MDYNRLAQNKYVVGFLILTSIIIAGVGIAAYVTNEPLAQADLIQYTGQVQNVEVIIRDDEPKSFTFNVSGSDKKFFYLSFYPDVESALNVMSNNPNVTVWAEPNTADETPDVWGIDVAGGGTLLSYDQVVKARKSNSQYGLLVGGAMALIGLGLMVHFLRME